MLGQAAWTRNPAFILSTLSLFSHHPTHGKGWLLNSKPQSPPFVKQKTPPMHKIIVGLAVIMNVNSQQVVVIVILSMVTSNCDGNGLFELEISEEVNCNQQWPQNYHGINKNLEFLKEKKNIMIFLHHFPQIG